MFSLIVVVVYIILGFAFLMKAQWFRDCSRNLWNQWKNCHLIARLLIIISFLWFTSFATVKTNTPPADPMNTGLWPDVNNLSLVLDIGDEINPQSLTTNQYKAGFALVRAETNSTDWLNNSPSNVAVCERWANYGVAEDVEYSPATNWSFVLGTNNVDGAFFSSSGTLSFYKPKSSPTPYEMPYGTDGDFDLPSRSDFLAPLHAAIGIVPPDGKFWYSTSGSNSMLFTWENVYFGRNTNSVVSFQTELFWTGDFIYRYIFPESLSATNFVIGAQHNGGGETYVINATNQPPAFLELYWKSFGVLDPDIDDNDGDGISDGDEVFVTGTDPDNEDSDGDGISDKDEIDNGTDPNNIDSDGDGVPDGDDPSPNTPNSADEDSDNDGYTYIEELFYGTSDENPNDTYNLPDETVTFSISGASEPNSLLNVDGFCFPVNGKSSLSLKFDVPLTIALELLNDPTVSVSVSSTVCAVLNNKTGGFNGSGEGGASLVLPTVSLESYDIYINSIGQQVTASVTDNLGGIFEWRQEGDVVTTFAPSVGEGELVNGYFELRFYPTNGLNSLYASDDGLIIKDADIWCPHGLLPWECPDCRDSWCGEHDDWYVTCECIDINGGGYLKYYGDASVVVGGYCQGKTNIVIDISPNLQVKKEDGSSIAVGSKFIGTENFQVKGIGLSSNFNDSIFTIATDLHQDVTESVRFTVANLEFIESYGSNDGYVRVKAGSDIACYELITVKTESDLQEGDLRLRADEGLKFIPPGEILPTYELIDAPPASVPATRQILLGATRGGNFDLDYTLRYGTPPVYTYCWTTLNVEAVCVQRAADAYFARYGNDDDLYVSLHSYSHDPDGYKVYIDGSEVDDGQPAWYVSTEALDVGTHALKVISESFNELYEEIPLHIVTTEIAGDLDHSGIVGDSGDSNANGEYDLTGLVVPVNTNYLTKVDLDVKPYDMHLGKIELSASKTSDGDIKVWTSLSKQSGSLIINTQNSSMMTKTWVLDEYFDSGDIPYTVYVEGTDDSSYAGDVTLNLRFKRPNNSIVTNQILKVTVVQLDIDVDTDRDGVVEVDEDEVGEDDWTKDSGAIYNVNFDRDGTNTYGGLPAPDAIHFDDNGDPCNENYYIDNEDDELDIAPLVVREIRTRLPAGWKVYLKAAELEDVYRIHVYKKIEASDENKVIWGTRTITADSPPHDQEVEVTQWVDQFGSEFQGSAVTGDSTFGIEGLSFRYEGANVLPTKHFDGYIDLTLELRCGNTVIDSDAIRMKVAPWIMLSREQASEEIWAADYGEHNDEFLFNPDQGYYALDDSDQLHTVANQNNQWFQDHIEIGFTQRPGGPKTHVVFRLPYRYYPTQPSWPLHNLFSNNVGCFQLGIYLGADYDSADYGGNLEVLSPTEEHPLGIVELGDSKHSKLLKQFLESQEVQSPQFDLSVGWLKVGHIDEVTSFLSNGEVVLSDTITAWNIMTNIPEYSLFFAKGATPVGGTIPSNSVEIMQCSPPIVKIFTGIDHTAVDEPDWQYIKIYEDSTSGSGAGGSVGQIYTKHNGYVITTNVYYTGSKIMGGLAITNSLTDDYASLCDSYMVLHWWGTNGNSYPLADDKFVLCEESLSWAKAPAIVTVSEILGDNSFANLNTNLIQSQMHTIETNILNLSSEYSTTKIPAIFFGKILTNGGGEQILESGSCFAFVPGATNLQPVNGKLYVIETALGDSVRFVDCWYWYHLAKGEVHCGSNVKREKLNINWWENQP